MSVIAKDPVIKDIVQLTGFLPDDSTIRRRIWHLENGDAIPQCKECGDPVKWGAVQKYFTWCSPRCSAKSRINRDKTKRTTMERYGVENPYQAVIVKDKIKQTNLERYGVDHFAKLDKCTDRIKQTNLEGIGVEYHKQLGMSKSLLERLKDPDWVYQQHIIQKKSLIQIAQENNSTPCTVGNYAKKHGIEVRLWKKSGPEKEIFNLLEDLVGPVTCNSRNIIGPYELDLYLPDLKIAFEFDGIYWHSELRGTSKTYHLDKTELCEKQGIRLIHIFENEWVLKRDIVESRIKNLLGLSERIYARKCEIREVNPKDKKIFLIQNHIQGTCASSVNLGLYLEDELAALMTFGKSRFSKKYEWELIRYCNKINTSVVGGASRLFKRFVRDYSPENIISYSDRRWNTGDLYLNLGFTHSHTSSPNYFYFTRNENLNLLSRNRFQKHKLEKELVQFDKTKSEWYNMKMNNYDRIWDCGNKVFVWVGN